MIEDVAEEALADQVVAKEDVNRGEVDEMCLQMGQGIIDQKQRTLDALMARTDPYRRTYLQSRSADE